MSSITGDILRVIDNSYEDPTFTEVFARLGYATHIEVKNTLRWLTIAKSYISPAIISPREPVICWMKLMGARTNNSNSHFDFSKNLVYNIYRK